LQDFPKRRASLTFGWHPSDAQITLESRRACLKNGQIVHGRAADISERRISADHDGSWSVSYTHRLTRYEPGVWPTIESSQTPQIVFSPAALPQVDFKVSATGGFEGVTDSKAFADRLFFKTEGLIRAGAPSGSRARDLTNDAVEMASSVLSPGVLEAETDENYALETAMWIGATLEQGVWYEISAPLSLPGIPQLVVQHRITFAFTRRVPCAARAAAPACVEIVVRATPDPEALSDLIADLPRSLHYSASIEARLVMDPTTLLSYAREEWVSWHASYGEGKGLLESEHLLSTTSYGSH
jgi:hypothetical protein